MSGPAPWSLAPLYDRLAAEALAARPSGLSLGAGCEWLAEGLNERSVALSGGLDVVGAQEVGAGGEISWRGDRSAERGDGETIAVMRFGAGARIVARSARPWLRVRRIFSDLAVFEVVPQGLAIVELAPGISAREVQTHAQPTLLVSSRVKLMVTGSS